MQINSLTISNLPSVFIAVGILVFVLTPILLFINIYSTNQNTALFFKESLQTNSIENLDRETHSTLEKKLYSNSKTIKYSIIFLPNLSYIPVLNNELFAWKLETKRITATIESGLILSQSSLKLFESITEANKAYTSSTYITGPEKSEFENIKSALSKSMFDLDKYQKLSKRHHPLFSPIEYLDTKLDFTTNEMLILNTSSVIHTLIDIAFGYTKIVESSHPFNEILSGSASDSNLAHIDLSVSLTKISEDSNILNLKTQGLIESIKELDLYKESEINNLLFLFELVLESISSLSSTTSILATSIEDTHTNETEPETINPILDILKNINNNHMVLSRNLEDLKTIQSKIKTTKSLFKNSNLITEIEVLENRTDKLTNGVNLLLDIAPIVIKTLNNPNPTRYLILGHSSDELRATGGFVSSLWVIEFSKGQNIQTRYYDTVRVDNWDKLELYPEPPDGLKKHMNAHVWLLRDVSWEADFPTTANIASDMFYLGQNIRVDGVIGINQWVLVKLIESIGDIKSPDGELISPLNFLSKIEQGTDSYGRAYTDLVLDGFIEKIFESNPEDINFFISTGENLNQLLNSKEITVYAADPDIQQLISSKGWDGQIKSHPGDYLFIIDSNVGWSKSDRNIQRETYYHIDLSKTPPRANLKLKYFNHSGSGSVSCNPQWVNRGTNYNQLKNACYWNYWRVYTPNNINVLSHTKLPIKDYSVASQVGFESAGNDSFKIESLYGQTVISGLSDTEAGESESINLVYDLPKEILRIKENTIKYSLLIQKQSGVRKRSSEITIVLPENYRIISSNQNYSITDENLIIIKLQITEDTLIDLVFEKTK